MMRDNDDSFLPQIESVFYATFHETRGTIIQYQVPEGLIAQSTLAASHGSSQPQIARTSTSNSSLRGENIHTIASSPPTLITTEVPRKSPSPIHRLSSGSTSTLESSAPSSPVSYRSRPPHASTSPFKSNRPINHPSSTAPILNFADISRFVIPHQGMCGRLVICSTQKHRVIGFPVCLEGPKYPRVHFRYNLCFVFERTADLSCYEPVVRKIARVLMACEEESSFLSNESSGPQIHSILEQLYADLNSYHETSIIIDQFNSIEVKLFPFYPNPPEIYDWTVPLALINIMDLIEPNWDVTMAKVVPHIDGVNYVSRIACLADCDLELTRQAISHLLYYQCIMTIDIFQYSNIYTLGRSLQWLADDPIVKAECGPYVTKPGYDVPDWPHLLFLYSRLKPGKTVLEWMEEHHVYEQGIDVRRFMTFGVIKGFLQRIHRWPILLPKKPPNTPVVELSEEKALGVAPRKRGKSFSITNSIATSPAARPIRERSQSQSQTVTAVSMLRPQRKLTEAEEYARAVQLGQLGQRLEEANIIPLPASDVMPPPPIRRGSGIAHEIAESRRLSNILPPESPKLKRQPSGTLTPTTGKRRTPDVGATNASGSFPTGMQHSSSVTVHPNANPNAWPPELRPLLDGTRHTDELCTKFGTGWPVLEKWLCALGGGEGSGDYGRVVIMYR
ncbi:hypothetical protein M422DRAFT_785263 [Sphaerobolus stellatus SS14]|uniref:Nitrogen permease regulator 2 n=1 Tax=Sphaerobolus stellatus (strain SS14) TaxID=990650 RepID=A0A0C9UMF3_SPHS4|nr:hypothetical protein M422DRAFT_785263 [Sphaerobolus stellatus SS14]